MKTIIILLTLTILTSCSYDKEKYGWVCSSSQRKDVQDFIANNIKNANNMSDEEMEDVIAALYRAGVKTVCQCRTVKYELNQGNVTKVYNLEENETLMPSVW